MRLKSCTLRQNEINVVADKLYLFPPAVNLRRALVQSMQIAHVTRPPRPPPPLPPPLGPDLQEEMFCFGGRESRSAVPSVTPLTPFMGQQVAGPRHVTPAGLIMWTNKSAAEENVSEQEGRGCGGGGFFCCCCCRGEVEMKEFNSYCRVIDCRIAQFYQEYWSYSE